MKTATKYSRQTSIPEIGAEGQMKLKASKVLIIGAGGLGSPVALYLAAAGVGTLGIIDYDTVSPTNLNRQILYDENDINKSKAESASNRIKSLNSDIKIETYSEKISEENRDYFRTIFAKYDIIVDACDNMPTRYLIGDLTDCLSIPLVYGAMEGFYGYVSVFNDKSNYKRFRDLWAEETSVTKHNIPAIGVTAGVIGSIQACEVVKLICGFGDRLAGRLLTIDLSSMNFQIIEL